ncbi:MAG TPA: anthranilate phosphoribosyltransferase [Trueperaceae bacterium]|nr:anthranilate phosphoribosyltransferase [Trueperaceae bacterium]
MSDNFEIAELLEDVFAGATLSAARARDVMGRLMDGKLSQMQAAALLAALRTRGESVDEIVGFAQAMRERAVKVPVRVEGPLIDTCGTGGTGLEVINISTTAMFVAAAAGARVAKHGNVGVTRKSGSADVLAAVGARLDLSPEEVARALEVVGLAFVFARNHHPAMRFVAPIRADLRARTIFNNLGPLTNPAGANRQLMGVFAPDLTRRLAEVLKGLGVERALVVHGDGLDDFTVTGISLVTELSEDGTLRDYELAPEDVGLRRHPLSELKGGEPGRNAAALRAVLAGDGTPAAREVVAFNAGAAIYLAGLVADIPTGVAMALQTIDSGAAARKLAEYLVFTNAAAGAA